MFEQHRKMRLWTLMGVFVWLLVGCGGGGGGAGGAGDGGASAPPSTPQSYSVGGSTSGVVGPGLVLQLNGDADMAVDLSRDFSFAPRLNAGMSYQVTIKSNPVGQICAVTNGRGAVTADVANVSVACTTPVPAGPDSFKLGGTISGLTGSGLTLRNGSQDLQIPAGSTNFVFAGDLGSGSSYQVRIVGSPTGPAQTCNVSNGMGTVASADVTNVVVTCVAAVTAPASGLALDKSVMTFTGEEGQAVAAQTLSGSITGANEPVHVTITFTDQGLLFASFNLVSSTSGQLLVTPRQPSNIAPGTYTDTITVTACFDRTCTRPVAGSPKQVEVTYTVKAPSPAPTLRLSDRGVAFASVPGASQLSRTLVVRDSSGTTSSWTASSNVAWLNATASGMSRGPLILTADPSGLSNGFHMATVTVTSTNPAISTAEAVRVGLYISATESASSFSAPTSNSLESIAETTLAVDSIRPLVYSTAGSEIAANHVHTGERVSTVNVDGANFGGVAISDDGSRLYALNYANGTIVVVDLDSMNVLRSYGFPQLRMSGEALKSSRITHARVHGQSVLLMSYANQPIGDTYRSVAPVFKADTGELVGELYGAWPSEASRLAVSRDGTTVYTADAGRSGALSTTRIELRANSLGNVYGRAVAMTSGVNEASLQDIATNADGSRVLVGYGTDRSVREAIYDGVTLQWTSGLPDFVLPSGVNGMGPADLEFDAYGKLFAHDYTFDVRVYGSDGALAKQWFNLSNVPLASGRSGSMRISSDGLRLIGNGQLMTIQPQMMPGRLSACQPC